MELSEAGFEFLKAQEGVRTTVYLDSRRLPTVGIGHLVLQADGLVPGDTITDDQVQQFFDKDSAWDTDAINRLVTAPLNQNQFDALFSLVYNIGSSNFAKSHVLAYLNQGSYQAAADAFLAWQFAGGRPILKARRQRERALFLTPVENEPAPQ